MTPLAKELLDQAKAQTASPARKAPQSPADQAADSLLNKRSKLQLALEAALVNDANQLLDQDRRDVQNLKAKYGMGEKAKADEPVGDIIIGDDIHLGNTSAPRPNPAIPWIVAALLAAGGTGLAGYLANRQPVPPAPSASAPASGAQPPAAVIVREPLDEVTYEVVPDGKGGVVLGKELKRSPYKR